MHVNDILLYKKYRLAMWAVCNAAYYHHNTRLNICRKNKDRDHDLSACPYKLNQDVSMQNPYNDMC